MEAIYLSIEFTKDTILSYFLELKMNRLLHYTFALGLAASGCQTSLGPADGVKKCEQQNERCQDTCMNDGGRCAAICANTYDQCLRVVRK